MASYNVPKLSPLERIDELLELIGKEAHEIKDNMSRVNKKLLPSTELIPLRKATVEEESEKAQPNGWFNKKICHLEQIQNLLGIVNKETMLLKNIVLEKSSS